MSARVGERDVGLPRAREIRIKLEGMADVDHDQERRPSLGGRQRPRVLFGLAPRRQHGGIPSPRAPHGHALPALACRRQKFERRALGLIASLLGLQHEAAALVKIDEPRTRAAVAMDEGDRPLENVGVLALVRLRRLRAWQAQHAA